MKRAIVAVCMLLLAVAPAFGESSTNVLTHQGGRQDLIDQTTGQILTNSCFTTGNLPANQLSVVSQDSAAQPCANLSREGSVSGTVGDSDDSCDSTTNWSYDVQGHVTFGPPISGALATSLQVEVFSLCAASPATPTCPAGWKMVESSTIPVSPYNESFRFSALLTGLPASAQTHFYVLIKPNNGSVQCTANNYVTTEHN
jgi:hypothetical protein